MSQENVIIRKLIVTAALVLAAALALPNPSSAAPPPTPPTTQDSVLLTVTGVPALVYSLGAPVFDLLAINAHLIRQRDGARVVDHIVQLVY